MFGRDWQPGRATIIARKNIPRNQWTSSYEFIADVHPDGGGPVFRATFRGPLSNTGFDAPLVGAVVPVFIDAKHQKVKFDVSDPSLRWDTRGNAESAAFDAVRRGEAVPPAPPAAPSGPSEAEIRAASDALVAALATGRAAMAAFSVAKAAGDTSALARLKAEIASTNVVVQRCNDEVQRLEAWRRSGSARPAAEPLGPASGSAVPGARLDRLQQLADLHDRGVLNDSEFAIEKAKILNEG